MGKKKRKKTPAEEWTRWDENQRLLESLIERRLACDRTTRDEISRRLGLPQ